MQNTRAGRLTRAKPGRKFWGKPLSELHNERLSEEEADSLISAFEHGSVPDTVELDAPLSKDDGRTLFAFLASRDADAHSEDRVVGADTRKKLLAAVRDAMKDLKHSKPVHEEVLRRRLSGQKFREIARHMGCELPDVNWRHLEALEIIRSDYRVRDISSEFGLELSPKLHGDKEKHSYLFEFGFSLHFTERFTSRHLGPSSDSFEKLRVVASVIAEVVYPHCLKSAKENAGVDVGKDRLDIKRFQDITDRLHTSQLGRICRENPDLEVLAGEIRNYVALELRPVLGGCGSGTEIPQTPRGSPSKLNVLETRMFSCFHFDTIA